LKGKKKDGEERKHERMSEVRGRCVCVMKKVRKEKHNTKNIFES